jgi:hypothetical protein
MRHLRALGVASVVAVGILVSAYGQQPLPPANTPAFDVTIADKDDNGLPLNPTWSWQANAKPPDEAELCQRPYDDDGHPIDLPFREAQCTTQRPTFDLPRGFRAVVCSFGPITPGDYLAVPGHVNWQTATFTGPVTYTNYNPGDHDINFFIEPPGGAAVFPPSPSGFEIEFNADEVVNAFEHGWWQQFKKGSRSVDHRPSVVLGQLGLDCDHACGTELHPAYAMAINTAASNWSLFARNWGNEGFCSSHDHQLASTGNQLRVTIPWATGASDVTITSSEFYATAGIPAVAVSVVKDHGVVFTFTLLTPDRHALIYGDVVLQWVGASRLTETRFATPTAVRPAATRLSADERIARLLRARPQLRARLARPSAAQLSASGAQRRVNLNITPEPLPAIQTSLRQVRYDAETTQLDRSFRILCGAFNNRPPDDALAAGCAALRLVSPRR